MDSKLPPNSQSTIEVTHRTKRTIPMFVLQHVVRIFRTLLIKSGKELPAGSPKLDPHKTAKKQFDIKERVVEDVYIYDFLPKSHAAPDGIKKSKRIYYFAGGGWQMPPSSQHRALCTEFAERLTDTTMSIVSYPLAPNSPAPVAFPYMMRMYKRLLRDAYEAGEKVILAGDSAGGNVVLCLCLAALVEDESTLCPTALLTISPSCDLRRQNPDIKVLEKHDPLLTIPFINSTAQKWRGEWDAADPRVTPIMADVSALARRGVQVHGVVGRYDILSPDVVLFRAKCEQAGVKGEWLEWEKQMHVFPLAWPYKLPESVEGKEWILNVLGRI